jgi:DNA-binding MarR family transcriptional regulator
MSAERTYCPALFDKGAARQALSLRFVRCNLEPEHEGDHVNGTNRWARTKAPKLTHHERRVLEVLAEVPGCGLDLLALAERAGTSPEGVARTASSLRRKRMADRFVGGVGRQRVHYQVSAEALAR